MANMHLFTCCCLISLLCVPGKAINRSSLLEIANYVLKTEEAAGNFVKGYQHLAEAILRRLGPFFPEHRFVVLVADKQCADYKTGHTEYFNFNRKISVLINIALAVNSFVGSVDCYGNITAEFENCYTATEKIQHHIGEMCSMPNYDVLVWVVRTEAELGVASSFPANAFRDQLFGCLRGKQRWRVVIALLQYYETAQDELFRSLMGNFTRIKSRANGKFVSAQNGGDGPLAAVRDRVGIWEEFSLIQNPEDGTVSLRARANGKLVAADLNQAGRLVARSKTVQQWEKFQLERKKEAKGNEGTFTLKARANGKFVAVDRASQVLVADRDSAEDVATIFEFSSVLSGLAQGQVMEFPTIDEGANAIRVPVLLLILSSVGNFLFLLALAISCLFVCLLYKYSGEIRGSFGLQVSAFWLLRVRNRLDKRLDNTAIDNEYLLYSGPNSRVYFARFRWAPDEVREVAVKVPSKEAFRMDMIIEETRINAQLRHPRIVEYIGYYRDAFRDMRIVSEFMAGGDLHKFLGDRKNHLTVGHLFNFMGQIAEGMEYLASRRIIHRDLAARNCMLDQNCTSIKIADFGLSRHFKLDSNYTCTSPVRLPIRWTAIECLGQNAEILPNSKFSEKSDVWSFGIVVWECFTRGEMPYGAKEVREVLGELRGGWRLPRPPNCPPPLFEKLVLNCWEGRPELRPDFTKVRQMIDEIFSQVVIEMPERIADPVG